MSDFEQRLAVVERSNRRWKWCGSLLGLSLLLATAVAADAPDETKIPDVIYARKFVAVNEHNEPVAFMGHCKNVGIVSVADPDGTLLFVASATDSGHGVVTTFDGDGHPLVSVGANHSGDGHVAVFDDRGEKVSQAAASASRRTPAQPASTPGRRAAP